MNYLIFDIGGTAVKYAVSNELGELLEKGSVAAHQTDFNLMLDELESVYTSCNPKYEICGIAISSPGFVDSEHGVVYGYSALPCIHRFPIAKAISERLGGLPVSMENDGNCGALGEVWKGSGQGKDNVVMLVCGSGIGGGYVQGGRIRRTKNFSASEFGFMPLVCEGEELLGWSDYSVVNTVKHYNRATGNSISAQELFDGAENDGIKKHYADLFYHYLAVGCLTIGFALDPDIIIFGGAISARKDFKEKFDGAMQEMKQKNASFRFNETETGVSLLGNDANLYGALYNFLHCGTCK